MEVLILMLFVSLILGGSGVGFYVWNLGQRTHEHSDRLALLPLEEPATGPQGDPACKP